MKDYKELGNIIEITLDNDKKVKVSAKWAHDTCARLDTDMEDVLLMYLEDKGYLKNEEQEELDNSAKGQVKVDTDKPKKKTQKERVIKENPTKELIINTIATALGTIENATDIIVENKAKLITFALNGEQFKVDLVQKRKEKAKN